MKELVDVKVPKPKGVEAVTAPEAKKKTVGERIAEAREDAIVLEATEKAHGLGQGGGAQPESLAVGIVTKAMTLQSDAINDMKEDAKELQKEVKEAHQSVGEMQTVMMQDMLKRIEASQIKLDESAKTAQASGAPQDAFGYYRQVKGELAELVGEIKKQQPEVAAAQPAGMSEATHIKLKELELEQSRVLAQITADNTRAREQFQLQMAEFQDSKETRKQEYQDKKHFREEGLHGVSDMVASISAGLSQGSEPGNPDHTAAKTPRRVSESEEPAGAAYISSFKCEFCGSDVPVAEGQEVAQCPNPECGAQYTIKTKE